MTEEMQKRIDAEADKRATKLYPVTSIREMSKELVLQTVYDSGFKDGAKFILEMPELRLAIDCLEKARSLVHQDNVFGTGVEWTNFRYWSVEADQALSKLKALGIVKEGEK